MREAALVSGYGRYPFGETVGGRTLWPDAPGDPFDVDRGDGADGRTPSSSVLPRVTGTPWRPTATAGDMPGLPPRTL